jgi:hypothetical protein
MQNPLRVAIQHVGQREPLLLAHHPTCEFYDHHVLEVYGQKLCMGCFVVYPVGFVSLVTLLLGSLLLPSLPVFGIDTIAFYGIGFALAGPMLADKALPGHRSRRTRILAKAALAIGLAWIAFPGVVRPGDRLVTAALFFGFLVPYVLYKGLTVRDDCAGCPEYDDFPHCTGMTFDGSHRVETEESDD